jgi:hypothetical protein
LKLHFYRLLSKTKVPIACSIKPTTCLIDTFCNKISWNLYFRQFYLCFQRIMPLCISIEPESNQTIKSASRFIGFPEAETKVISSTTFYVNQLNHNSCHISNFKTFERIFFGNLQRFSISLYNSSTEPIKFLLVCLRFSRLAMEFPESWTDKFQSLAFSTSSQTSFSSRFWLPVDGFVQVKHSVFNFNFL